jgi:hypothetical protein
MPHPIRLCQGTRLLPVEVPRQREDRHPSGRQHTIALAHRPPPTRRYRWNIARFLAFSILGPFLGERINPVWPRFKSSVSLSIINWLDRARLGRFFIKDIGRIVKRPVQLGVHLA